MNSKFNMTSKENRLVTQGAIPFKVIDYTSLSSNNLSNSTKTSKLRQASEKEVCKICKSVRVSDKCPCEEDSAETRMRSSVFNSGKLNKIDSCAKPKSKIKSEWQCQLCLNANKPDDLKCFSIVF